MRINYKNITTGFIMGTTLLFSACEDLNNKVDRKSTRLNSSHP